MKKIILFLASIPAVLSLPLEGTSITLTENLNGSALAPLAELLGPLLVKLSVLVGGIFGLYVILIFLRVYYERKNMKLLQHIRYNLDQQNRHYGIPSSEEKKGFLHRHLIDKIVPGHIRKHYQPFKKEKR